MSVRERNKASQTIMFTEKEVDLYGKRKEREDLESQQHFANLRNLCHLQIHLKHSEQIILYQRTQDPKTILVKRKSQFEFFLNILVWCPVELYSVKLNLDILRRALFFRYYPGKNMLLLTSAINHFPFRYDLENTFETEVNSLVDLEKRTLRSCE